MEAMAREDSANRDLVGPDAPPMEYLDMHHLLQAFYLVAASCGSAAATSWRCASW